MPSSPRGPCRRRCPRMPMQGHRPLTVPCRGRLPPSAGRNIGPAHSDHAHSLSRWAGGDFRGQAGEERRPGGQRREPGPLQEGAVGVPCVWQGNTPHPVLGLKHKAWRSLKLELSSACRVSGGTVQGEADIWVVSFRVHSLVPVSFWSLLLSSSVSSE